MSYCIRGCTRPRRHLSACAGDDECRGCLPREAEYGLLCFGCHKRLTNMLRDAPGQHSMLLATAAASTEQALTQETTAKIGDGWRLDSDARHQGPYARTSTISAPSSEPVRLAALSAAQDLADWLSEMVERLVDDYAMRGPEQLLSMAEREDPRRKVWREALDAYVWIDPPLRFEVHTAAGWLTANIERIEHSETVGDDLEALAELMGQAHALAPWREQVARLHGIPCPSCHRTALVRFGGEVDVQCVTPWCHEVIPPQRYGIWVRMLADEQREASA